MMKILIRIILVSALIQAGYDSLAQESSVREENKELKAGQVSPPDGKADVLTSAGSDQKSDNKGNREENVKQVKSAKPDMTRKRGARPPDIVRPSGSRIPRGVGRPAGAGRRGR